MYPESGQTRSPLGRPTLPLDSPQHRQQSPSKSHRRRRPPSPKNSPKDCRRSSTIVASGHLLRLLLADHCRLRTRNYIQLIALVSGYKPKSSTTDCQKMPTKSQSRSVLPELSSLAATVHNHFWPRNHHRKIHHSYIHRSGRSPPPSAVENTVFGATKVVVAPLP